MIFLKNLCKIHKDTAVWFFPVISYNASEVRPKDLLKINAYTRLLL